MAVGVTVVLFVDVARGAVTARQVAETVRRLADIEGVGGIVEGGAGSVNGVVAIRWTGIICTHPRDL